MKFEVIEQADAWVVAQQGVEVGRFERQGLALDEVARLLREAEVGDAGVALSMRYRPPSGPA
ncbi:hypothetical protein [Phenylobacterium sp.]|uniref:hypothetical protein n=1 Tax=Phenylobacterium sp. TaxID=1871053 RepID=UPI0035B1498C